MSQEIFQEVTAIANGSVRSDGEFLLVQTANGGNEKELVKVSISQLMDALGINAAAQSIKQLYHPTGTEIGSLTKDSTINNSGVAYNNTKRARTALRSRNSGTTQRLAVSLDLSGYEYAIALYTRPSSLYDGTGFIGYQDINGGSWTTGMTIISTAADNFVLAFRHKVSGTEQTITDADISAIEAALVVYASTDQTVSTPRVPADAKATGDRISVLEDASLHWVSWSPALSQKQITDNGGVYTSVDNYHVHTYSLWNGRNENAAVRYAVNMSGSTYQYRVASYGENGSYGSGGTGVDFNGFVTDWTTGTVVLPANCRKFAIDVKKANGGQCQTSTDDDAIKAALTVLVATDTTLSISGRAADAKAVRDFIAPELTAEHKQDILDLIDSYIAAKSNIVYYYDQSINGLASSTYAFDNNNKLKLCCSVWADLIWSGISPDTFFGAGVTPSNYDATIVKAFNWGWKHPYYLHQRTDKLAVRSGGEVTGYWGYKEPDGDITKSYSYTTFYDPDGTLPNSQRFINNLIASSMACELYHMGYEVPIAKADVGDLIFFTAFPYELTPMINIKFRGIGHVGVIVGKTNGFFEIAECGTYSDGMPIAKVSIFNNDEANAARAGHLYRRTVMTFRHPAAFGVSSNVGSKIVSIPARY